MNILKRLWRWHPEVALRYLPIVGVINSERFKKASILEVGSGSLGIAPYLGRPVTAVDFDFSGPQIDLLTKIKGSVLKLPFPKEIFDIVILVDVLEHIPLKERFQAISEASRVSKKILIISTPYGEIAQKEDKFLSSYYFQKFGKHFKFFDEHLAYQIPKDNFIDDTIIEIAKKNRRGLVIKTENRENILLHRFLMKGWITKNLLINIIFRKLFLIFIPIMLFFNQKPTYRKNYYIFWKK